MVGYGDRTTFQNLYNITVGTTAFSARDTEYYYMINNYLFGDPQTTTTDTEDLALIRTVAHQLHIMAFNFQKAMTMENPPEFITYKMPHLTEEMKAILDVVKMKGLTDETKLIYVSD